MKYPMTIALVAMALLTISVAAYAGEFGPRFRGEGKGGHGMMGMWKQLELTETQKSSLKEIIRKYRSETGETRMALPEAMAELSRAIHAEALDEDAVRDAHRKISEIKEEMVVVRAKVFAEFKPQLTTEQLERIDDMIARRLGRMEARMEMRRARMAACTEGEPETETETEAEDR